MAKVSWLDIREVAAVREVGAVREAVVEEAVHQGVNGILAADVAHLDGLPPTVTRVLLSEEKPLPEEIEAVDVVVIDPRRHGDLELYAQEHPQTQFGEFVEIVDAPTLEQACEAARVRDVSVLDFRDPTKIPLEIVIAAAAIVRVVHPSTGLSPEAAYAADLTPTRV